MANNTRDKENKKAAKAAKRAQRKQQRAQMWQAFKLQKERDKALVPLMLIAFLLPILLMVLLSLVWGYFVLNVLVGVLLGASIALWVFSSRLQKGVYDQIEGEPGAAAWALQNMRNGVGMKWITEPGVVSNKHMDIIHRVVGTPGVVLVGEGNPQRLKPMIAKERAELSRVLGDTPIYDVTVGNDEGQVPIKKLQSHMMRMPRNIKKNDVDALNSRVESISRLRSAQQAIPKGPLPKGGKVAGMNRRTRRAAERGKR